MTDTEALEEALKTVADYSKRLERKNARLTLSCETATKVCRVAVEQLNEWQALAEALAGYANHMHSCYTRSSALAECTCGLSALRKNPLLK